VEGRVLELDGLKKRSRMQPMKELGDTILSGCDLFPVTRWEKRTQRRITQGTLAKSVSGSRTTPLSAGLLRKVSRYVGPLIPNHDRQRRWNLSVDNAFVRQCCNRPVLADMAAAVNYYQAQSLLVKQMAIGGDVFWQQVISKMGRGMFD